jgi:endonuclease YncB( thermonuclease family)
MQRVSMLSLVLLLAATPLIGSPIYGVARAGDGDSLQIGSTRIRLFGIDAPELDQTCKKAGSTWNCGQGAADRLSKLVTGREVRCDPVSIDQYGRVLARCSVLGIDVNRNMVAAGYAVAFRKYSTDYVSAEESARVGKRGIWAGAFDMPSEVRASQRALAKTAAPRLGLPARQTQKIGRPAVGACVIKGNRSRRGQWIYHLPGMPYYGQTRAEETFCTEAEAQAAGYRRAKVR